MNELSRRLPVRRRRTSLAAAIAVAVIVLMALAPAVAASPIGAGLQTQAARAAAARPVATAVKVVVPTGGVLGSDVTVVATLRNRSGAVLANQHLSLYLDNVSLRSDKTDAHGSVSFIIPGKKLNVARSYAVRVAFAGSHGYSASAVDAALTILAAAVQIHTVPPLPNLRFTLGAETAVTGIDGIAALPVPQAGTYQITADLNPDNSPTATVKASFVRWLDDVYVANRTVDITGPATYTMGLTVAYRASIKYVDLNNQPVDPTLIQQAQFSTGTGTNDVVLNSQTGASDVWWTAASVARVTSSLLPTTVTYRALSVQIHGAQVVNRGQQAWTPTQNGVWTIQLLLYGMTVTTHDAMFGMPVSGQLALTYPDGDTIKANVDSNGVATFTNLPRGQYQLKLTPAAYSPPTPVALSRPQNATIRVITYLDVAVAAGALILVVLALFLVGRGAFILARLRRNRARAARPVQEMAS